MVKRMVFELVQSSATLLRGLNLKYQIIYEDVHNKC